MADETLDLRFLQHQNDKLSREIASLKEGSELIERTVEMGFGSSVQVQEIEAVSPSVYWSRLVVILAARRETSYIYVFEAIFLGAAGLFLYLIIFSPTLKPLNIVDVFIITILLLCTLTIAAHYLKMARISEVQLREAVEHASASLISAEDG